MAFTSHGHHIHGTDLEVLSPTYPVARCGGPGLCPKCSEESAPYLKAAAHVQTRFIVGETHSDETLDKVYDALIKAVGKNLAQDCVREMQNAGILFRERI